MFKNSLRTFENKIKKIITQTPVNEIDNSPNCCRPKIYISCQFKKMQTGYVSLFSAVYVCSKTFCLPILLPVGSVSINIWHYSCVTRHKYVWFKPQHNGMMVYWFFFLYLQRFLFLNYTIWWILCLTDTYLLQNMKYRCVCVAVTHMSLWSKYRDSSWA